METTEAKIPTMSEILQEAMTRIKKAAEKNVELETIANDLEKSIKEWDDFVRESDKINTALKKLIDDEGNIIEKSKIHSIGSNIEGLRRWVILQ